MKKLLLIAMISLPKILLAQSLGLITPTIDSKNTHINCQSNGSGYSLLTISLSTNKGIDSLNKATITSSGIQFHSFTVDVSNLIVDSEQMSFNFTNFKKGRGTTEGTYTINLKEVDHHGVATKVPTGEGMIDLTVKPNLGFVSVFDKYVLSNCSGVVK